MSPHADTLRFRRAIAYSLGFVIVLWLIKLGEVLSGIELHTLGVYPRDPDQLYGVVLAPLIHGSFSHLLTNTPALLVLGTATIYGYPRAARVMLPLIYLGSGIGVWFYARSSFHFGASGLTFGLMFFVFVIGALRWDPRASALSMLVFFLYGGMIWGIFPTRPEISFEYHFFGAALGVAGAIVLRKLDPAPVRKRYSWELEGETDDDPDWLVEGEPGVTPPGKPRE